MAQVSPRGNGDSPRASPATTFSSEIMSAVPKPIVMDVDTGIDDALAILFAVAHPELEVLGISCVAGNVVLGQVVINTCRVLQAAGAGNIPVAGGAAQPLIERARREGGGPHGSNGLGGIQLPAPSRQPSPLHGVELLHGLIMEAAEPVNLVSLAPKTNLALLLAGHPEIAARLGQIIFMGGSLSKGAEFNVWQDPEAAAYVIQSAIPIQIYGVDLFDRLVIEQADIERFRGHDHSAIRLAAELLDKRRPQHDGPGDNEVGLLGDAGALLLLTNPETFVTEELPVHIELEGAGRGQTIVARGATEKDPSWPDLHEWPRIKVVVNVDVAKAASAFVETINAFPAV
jgi:inosine-uridine nucleoside N-ribohydrolase